LKEARIRYNIDYHGEEEEEEGLAVTSPTDRSLSLSLARARARHVCAPLWYLRPSEERGKEEGRTEEDAIDETDGPRREQDGETGAEAVTRRRVPK
jgi:hypothetical protein